MEIGDLEKYGFTQKDYDDMYSHLIKKFNQEPSKNDVIWSLLLNYTETTIKTGDFSLMKDLAWDKAILVASEGKNPDYIIENAEKTLTQFGLGYIKTFGWDEIKVLRQIKREHGDTIPELMLLSADPTPAVLDELRKIYSARAWAAKKKNEWHKVIYFLDHYEQLANANMEFCIKNVNQAPPEHTEKDKKLLHLAKSQVGD